LKPADGKRSGEITPAYAILEPAVIQEVNAVCPDVSLFMLLREESSAACLLGAEFPTNPLTFVSLHYDDIAADLACFKHRAERLE
jgi:hypothetical protein